MVAATSKFIEVEKIPIFVWVYASDIYLAKISLYHSILALPHGLNEDNLN